MEFSTFKVPGHDAIRILDEYRSRYRTTGQYPFLIGDAEDLSRVQETADFNDRKPAEIIQASFHVKPAERIAIRRSEAEEYEFPFEEVLGAWPGEVGDKGSIGLHKDVLSKKVKPEVYFGLASIEEPWQLPAFVKYGGWNDCPAPDVHCAFFRLWQERYGAEITGMSGDVIECAVINPPTERETAIALAWEQYWYCCDIVDQGCGSVSMLAATLLNSRYWYFWWD